MKKENQNKAIKSLITRGVEQITIRDHLEQALMSGSKLRVKFGIDPTGSKIHIGRAIVLWKLREFQRLGHTVVLIIGDFTAQIGDPSDKLSKRPFLTLAEIKKNLKGYLAQIGTIVDVKRAEVRHNSEWLKKLNFQEIAQLAESFSIQQMIERRNFKDRWDKHEEISLREMLYPLMQGYDSVAVKADVELGGSDQLFNLFAGRKIQEYYNLRPQDIMTVQMLDGLDGRKMSTSWGNVINIDDDPQDMFGKVMSIPDTLMIRYATYLTGWDEVALEQNKKLHPREFKAAIGKRIVLLYHGEKAAEEAAQEFDRIFKEKQIPQDIPVYKLEASKLKEGNAIDLIPLLADLKLVESRSEARRLIEQGGVKINNIKITNVNETVSLAHEIIIQCGKRKFAKVRKA
jgi:tyrosyl-tRNA synthetase